MTQRLLVLTGHLLRSLTFSLTGLIYVIIALAYWAIFFPPGQGTPDLENYFIIIGAFGGLMAFLATLTVASRSNRAENSPLLVRLPSRIEYITAVFSSSIAFAFLFQFLIALLALIRGPQVTFGQLLEIPPVWLAINLLAAMMALHASDLVSSGWSRVVIYGVLAVLLIGQGVVDRVTGWLAMLSSTLSSMFYSQQWDSLASMLGQFSGWLNSSGNTIIGRILGLVFWPFRAIFDAIFSGYFTPTQALAPAMIVLYASILFLIAADLFATKDLEMPE